MSHPEFLYKIVKDLFEVSIEAQKIATEYIFDTKILLHVHDEDAIEDAAKNSIDGVVFSNAIID